MLLTACPTVSASTTVHGFAGFLVGSATKGKRREKERQRCAPQKWVENDKVWYR